MLWKFSLLVEAVAEDTVTTPVAEAVQEASFTVLNLSLLKTHPTLLLLAAVGLRDLLTNEAQWVKTVVLAHWSHTEAEAAEAAQAASLLAAMADLVAEAAQLGIVPTMPVGRVS